MPMHTCVSPSKSVIFIDLILTTIKQIPVNKDEKNLGSLQIYDTFMQSLNACNILSNKENVLKVNSCKQNTYLYRSLLNPIS